MLHSYLAVLRSHICKNQNAHNDVSAFPPHPMTQLGFMAKNIIKLALMWAITGLFLAATSCH